MTSTNEAREGLREAQDKRRAALIERIGTIADLTNEKPLQGELGDIAYDLLRQAASQISSDRKRLASLPTPETVAGEVMAYLYTHTASGGQHFYASRQMAYVLGQGWTETPLYTTPLAPSTGGDASPGSMLNDCVREIGEGPYLVTREAEGWHVRKVDEPHGTDIKAAWADGFHCARQCVSDDAAFELTEDVEHDAWLDSNTCARIDRQATQAPATGGDDPELIARVEEIANATGKDRWKIANLTGHDWRRILAALRSTRREG